MDFWGFPHNLAQIVATEAAAAARAARARVPEQLEPDRAQDLDSKSNDSPVKRKGARVRVESHLKDFSSLTPLVCIKAIHCCWCAPDFFSTYTEEYGTLI